MTKPVLRFAPSPTGLLHVGNARVAMMNWLYARKHGGEFILRFDDTDPERSKDEYVDAIREDLKWLGIDWDREERQSLRQDKYDAAIEDLKSRNLLYPCYETEGELNWKRKAARQRHQPFIYDRKALTLSDDEIAAFEAEGRKPHWRFLLTDGVVEWDDLSRGVCTFDTEHVSDPVLIREDGSLLYMLGSVVDDLEMGVSHIIRGEDHVTNTVSQILLYMAMGGKPGALEFAHMPLLAGPGGSQLSKRLGSLSLRELRNDGFEVSALVGLLTGLGASDKIEPASLTEVLAKFDLGHYGRSTPKFDPAELASLNEKVIHDMSFEVAKPKLEAAGLSDTHEEFWNAVRGNCWRVAEAVEWWGVITNQVIPQIDDEDADFLKQAAGMLPEGELDGTSWKAWTGALKDATDRKGKQLFMPLRKALTGREHGPEMSAMLVLIGRDKACERLCGKAV
ncbi:glutamate--tRNA ligase [Thalassospira alkalitolerans]|uniref:glutamate--tRNA ligase n=1 Tax=Thalassospira alkalitolerans TaxID=1293890 RepID=UPI003AA876B7